LEKLAKKAALDKVKVEKAAKTKAAKDARKTKKRSPTK
jgi:hypothetical protein